MESRAFSKLVPALVLSLLAVGAHAGTIDLGTSAAYGVLGEAGVTNTGPTIVDGSVSGSAGTPAVTGFLPGTVAPGTGTLYLTGPPIPVAQPFDDALAAYNTAIGQATTETLTGVDLGGLTLDPGVYYFATSADLTGTLTLDALGSDDASWTFLIGSQLTTASASDVQLIDAATGSSSSPFTGGITWDVGTEATLGTTTTFLGTIIADSAAVTLDTGATIGCGRAISLGAAVTLDDNVIDATATDCNINSYGTLYVGPPSPPVSATPEPGTLALLPCGLLAMAFLMFRKSRVSL